MPSATLWADTNDSMWVGIGLIGAGIFFAGLILCYITKKEKGSRDG